MSKKILKAVCGILIISLAYGTVRGIVYKEKYETMNTYAEVIEQKCNSQIDKYDSVIEELNDRINDLERENSDYLCREESNQYTIAQLIDELNKLKEDKAQLQTENTQLKEQLAYKQSMGFVEPTPKTNSVIILNQKKQNIGSINVKIFSDDSLSWDKQRYWFFREIATVASPIIPDGLPLEALVIMAFTEGGAGIDGVYRNTNNLFGMKASENWKGLVFDRGAGKLYQSYEVARQNGAAKTNCFRAYTSIEESIKDHITVIETKFTAALSQTSLKGYFTILYKNKYCKEGNVSAWLSLINQFKLTSWLKEQGL